MKLTRKEMRRRKLETEDQMRRYEIKLYKGSCEEA